MKKIILLLALMFSSYTHADNTCNYLLSEGIRDSYSLLTRDSKFDLYQAAVCTESYEKYDSFRSGVSKFGLSIETAEDALGLKGSNQNKREKYKEAYDKFCSASNESHSVNAFLDYRSSSINVELARVFSECVSNNGIEKYMTDQGKELYIDAILQPSYASFIIEGTRKTGAKTTITQISPNDIECQSGGKSVTPGYEIKTRSFQLDCSKSPTEQIDFKIATEGEGSSNSVTLNAQNDRLSELESRLEELTRLVRINTPEEVVIAVNQDSCPEGWTFYEKAYGRFIRGIDRTNAKVDPDGLRTAGSFQSDAFQSHRHNMEHGGAPGMRNSSQGNGESKRASDPSYKNRKVFKILGPSTDGDNGSPRLSNETRPKNVALLFCEKES